MDLFKSKLIKMFIWINKNFLFYNKYKFHNKQLNFNKIFNLQLIIFFSLFKQRRQKNILDLVKIK